MSKKVRPTISQSNDVGKKRQQLYASAISKCNDAIYHRYYIEAIALEESLIADRLESAANCISGSSNFSYTTLECLLEYLLGANQKQKLDNYFSHHSKSQELQNQFQVCLQEIKEWKDRRNNAMHEMAKLDPDCTNVFATRYADLKSVAQEGIKVFKTISNIITKAQRAYNKQNKK